MKSRIKKGLKLVSNAVFTILVLIVIVMLVYVVYVKVMESSGRLSEVKVNFYTILTQSMYPTIEAGDIVITYKNDDNSYNANDIITFVSPNDPITITHRVIEVSSLNGKYYYRTKGDNNNTSDSTIIPADNVIGRVVFRIPKAGYIQQFLVSETGWIVAVVLPCLAIIIYDIVKVSKNLGKKGKDKINSKIKNNKRTQEAKKKLEEVLSDE